MVGFGSISTFLPLASRVRSTPNFRHAAALHQLMRWAKSRPGWRAYQQLARNNHGSDGLA